KEQTGALSLDADEVNVHAFTISRTQFRKTVEGSIHNSFMHSLLAKGRLLYTHDDSIAGLCERLVDIGERDTRLQLLGAATAALDAIDSYLAERVALFNPVIEHLREVGEARSCTEIENHFERNLGIDCITTACEYLADRGLIGRASTPVKVTKRSNIEVQEVAFVYLGEGADEF